MAKEKLDDWSQGVLMATSVLVACHGETSMASDIINELGLNNADCSGLDEFDKSNLRQVNEARAGRSNLQGLN